MPENSVIKLLRDQIGEKEFNRLEARANATRRLKSESDRAAGIVAAAFVEDELERCIRRHLIASSADHRDRINRLFNLGGPLGTFAVKIDIGWLMGIYSKGVRSDLKRLKDVRNKFAHNIEVDTFEHAEIRADCVNLKMAERSMIKEKDDYQITVKCSNGMSVIAAHKNNPLSTPRERYITTSIFLINVLANTYPQGRTHEPHF
jgi:hypothetical protein